MPSIPTAGAGRSLLPALAALSILLAACGSGAQATSGPVATTTVDLPPSYRFDPVAITVPVGTTVTWTNSDNFTHNVAFDGSGPLLMRPGDQVSQAFDAPGTYDYVCSLHPQDMQGTVLVTES